MYGSESEESMIGQLDGNISFISELNNCDNLSSTTHPTPPPPNQKIVIQQEVDTSFSLTL